MSNAPFPIQPERTAIAIAYRNKSLIADAVLPRVSVGKQEFIYRKYNLAEAFTIPDTKVGRRGAPNEVGFTATETAAATEDYGLDDPVPQNDIDNATPPDDPVGRSVEQVTDLILLDREVRAANLVFTAANYPSGNKVTLSGTSRWSDFANSDPIADISNGLDVPVMRPNQIVFGRAVYAMLIRHPKVLAAVYKASLGGGIATRQQLADLFEVEEIQVGESFVNSAKRGQTATMSRVWGKHCALLYRDRLADTRNRTTFGFTAQFGTRIAGAMPDSKIGLRGGQRVRVGESVKELIVASDLGYFIENAVA